MKRYILSVIAIATMMTAVAQSPVEIILESVANNNNSIKAAQEEATAAQTELSAANCLENPSFEFEYLWAKNQVPGGNKYSFAIMQGFEFPTVYGERRKLINSQNSLNEAQVKLAQQEALLEAREICIKIVYLNKQIELVTERVEMARSLVEYYHNRLVAGDANQLEVNEVEIDYLSQSSRLRMLVSERNAAQSLLVACNGGYALPIDAATLTQYPIIAMPASLDEAVAQWKEHDASISMINNQMQMAESLTSVSKQGWIPSFEVGYKQVYESGAMFYGLGVGVSLPLFKTNNEVKSAKARALAISWQGEEANARIDAEATQLYEETVALSEALKEYEMLTRQNNRPLLLKAVESGQISLLEYMSGIALVNEAEENRLLLEYQYYSKLSQLNRDL